MKNNHLWFTIDCKNGYFKEKSFQTSAALILFFLKLINHPLTHSGCSLLSLQIKFMVDLCRSVLYSRHLLQGYCVLSLTASEAAMWMLWHADISEFKSVCSVNLIMLFKWPWYILVSHWSFIWFLLKQSLFWFWSMWKSDKYNVISDLGWKLFHTKPCFIWQQVKHPLARKMVPPTNPALQSIIFEENVF